MNLKNKFLTFFAFFAFFAFAQTYSTMPLTDDFSGAGTALGASFGYVSDQAVGRVDRRNLTGSWPKFTANNGSPNTGNGLAIYNSSAPVGTNNVGFRIYLNLSGATSSVLDFWGVDWGTSFNLHKMAVRISNNGGTSFTTVTTFNISNLPYSDGIWNPFSINLLSLASANGIALTSTMVVELRIDMSETLNLTSPKSWPSEGFYIDNFSVTGTQVLPVEMISFEAEKMNAFNYLTWSTASEINNDYFEVQKSVDGTNFETIGNIQGVGNSTVQNDYQFIDHDAEYDIVYYRLKQVDFDGTISYSKIKRISNKSVNTELTVINNGSEPVLQWAFDSNNQNVVIYNQAGQLVYNGMVNREYSFSGHTAGMYTVAYWNGSEQITQKVVKQ